MSSNEYDLNHYLSILKIPDNDWQSFVRGVRAMCYRTSKNFLTTLQEHAEAWINARADLATIDDGTLLRMLRPINSGLDKTEAKTWSSEAIFDRIDSMTDRLAAKLDIMNRIDDRITTLNRELDDGDYSIDKLQEMEKLLLQRRLVLHLKLNYEAFRAFEQR